MYARLLFVVVGILGAVSAHFGYPAPLFSELRLGFPKACGYTLAA
jgi:hypothetical protein